MSFLNTSMNACEGCGGLLHQRVLRTDAVLVKGKMWHVSCLVCSHCREPLIRTGSHRGFKHATMDEAYVEREDACYHITCYAQAFDQQCDVCQAPLVGSFYTDGRGYRFCARHKDTVLRCFSCHRLVCESITGGGWRLSDGRAVCALCQTTAVTNAKQASQAVRVAKAFLRAVECDLGLKEIPLILVDGNAMRTRLNRTERQLDAHRVACGQTCTVVEKVNGKVSSRAVRDIAILTHLSQLHFTSVAVHELCHAWLFLNEYWHLPIRVEEGLCVFMEYVYLKHVAERAEKYNLRERDEALFLMRLIEKNTDTIYGEGFRAAREAVRGFGLRRTLAALRGKKYWPGTTPLRDDFRVLFRRFFC